LEKSPWAVFLRSRPGSALPQPNPVGKAGPHSQFPQGAAKWAPKPRGPHLSASLLHGWETATHPTRYRARYAQTHPLSSSLASHRSPAQFWSTGHPQVVPQRCPAEGRCCAVWPHHALRRPLAPLHACAAVASELSPRHQSYASAPGAKSSPTNQGHDRALMRLLGCR
jgi:hypothetical protein